MLHDTNMVNAEDDIKLSKEQESVLNDVQEGRSVFITGSAGVGKSFLLQEIIKSFPKRSTHVTASTGVAACNIGGSTLHSFAGIGLGDKSTKHYVEQIRKSRFKADVKQRWIKCKILVIDEISMIDGHLFEKVEEVARMVRNNPAPFGGIQLILCGDFLQLPPVKNNYFAFETKAWKRCVNKTIVLGEVFRQRNVGFISLLNRLRVGYITSIDIEVLHCCHRTLFPDDGIKPTCLFPLRATCDKVNQNELEKLRGKSKTFKAHDIYQNEFYQKQLETSSRLPKELILKEGAQVMLLCNKSVRDGLVNGARGVVVGFHDRDAQKKANMIEEQARMDPSFNKEEFMMRFANIFGVDGDMLPIVRFVNGIEMVITQEQNIIEVAGKTVAYRNQVPLALAWAVSVHKSQGVTLDRVEINLSRAFEHGQSYVALSRVTSLDGLLLRAFNPTKIIAHPKVLAYYTSIDSTFTHYTKSMGESDLKVFLENRRNYGDYKRSIDEQTRIHKLKQDDTFRCLREHDYCKRHLDHQVTNSIYANGASNSFQSTETSIRNENSHPKNSHSCSSSVNEETNLHVTDTSSPEITNNTSPSPVTKILSKADGILLKCKQSLNDLQTGNIDTACDNTKSSDDDISFFDDDQNDGLFEEELCKVDTPKAGTNFFNQICPDLLRSASQSTPILAVIRGRKRRLNEPFDNICKNEKENKTYVQTMLKAKESQIEENRRKALERRYNSLKRTNVRF